MGGTLCGSSCQAAPHSEIKVVRGVACAPHDLGMNWKGLRRLDLSRLPEVMETPTLIHGRNFFDPAAVRQAGFAYVGRGPGWNGTGG